MSMLPPGTTTQSQSTVDPECSELRLTPQKQLLLGRCPGLTAWRSLTTRPKTNFAALSVTQDMQPKPHACVAGYAACCTVCCSVSHPGHAA
jgi:hypothetical protein